METNVVKKRSLKDIQRHTNSPFDLELLNNTSIEARKKLYKVEKTVVDKYTDVEYTIPEVVDSGYYWKDSAVYTKLYQTDKCKDISKLGSSAYKMFMYIVQHLEMNKAYIYIGFKEFTDFSGNSSRTSYYDAVLELVAANIIALQPATHMYHVNPNIIFNGKRESILPSPEIVYMEKMRIAIYEAKNILKPQEIEE